MIEKSNRLKGKDQVTIGIFAAIYFVLSFLSNVSGGIHPILWIMSPIVAALLGATPYMLAVSKVKKPLAILMLGIIVGFIYFITGQFPYTVPIGFIIGAIIAEIIRYKTKYDSFWANALGFSFFSMGMAGSPLPLWIYRESFIAQILEYGMSQEYVNSLESIVSPSMLVVMIVSTFFAGLFGALLSRKIFKKHFNKVGIV
ncbi:MAG: MptD family putative ECF transporter S component [Tepidibacter sp.]|jgi:energy-coupling factor transport system substrate-specific component|uniref:MptD family putative ECF transporter S component n=1 Tax=Tepidibacter sp. TaxID=2529387 RepID=UPI0025D98733|nr:MptD family putative ECF transporter S component [Tepidibacter sp.]MCT4509299.1 MptD family putative ECF transporter S component [Tepidibacter sp.]